jgi:hypothetical protein
MVQRIDTLYDQYKTMSQEDIRTELIAWDNDNGRANGRETSCDAPQEMQMVTTTSKPG